MLFLTRKIFFTLFFIMANLGFAIIDIEITQGLDSAIPLAVVPFVPLPHKDDVAAADMHKVIQQDLLQSGTFKLFPANNMQQLPHKPDEINYPYWGGAGVDYVVVGAVVNNNGNYDINFAVVDIIHKLLSTQNPQNDTQMNNVLLAQTVTTHDGRLRHAAHHISDLIYEKITGIRGDFTTRIAYVNMVVESPRLRRYTLEVADADGFNQQGVVHSTEPLMSPVWSPDGKQIAFVSFANKRAEIKLVDLATGHISNLSNFPGINGAPTWSPDGGKLALVLSKDGAPKIYVLDLASRHLQQLTTGMSIDTEPNFAPDGSSLIFTSNRGGSPQIYCYYFATGKIERLTFTGDYNARARFLPNGKSIVLLHRTDDRYNIATLNLATHALQILTTTALDESPSVSPNGQSVLYATSHNERGVLAKVSIDGRAKWLLPARIGDVQEPAWSNF